MKIVQINTTCGKGSTGKICVAISKLLTEQGIENYILYTDGSSDYSLGIKYAGEPYIRLQSLKSHVLGNYGFNSHLATKKLLRHLDRIQPDIIHLHNLHGHNVNISMLFDYIKQHNIKVIWTFHDCWAFTACCPHFTMARCDKWKNGCSNCPQFHEYSFFIDRSRELYENKRVAMQGLDMTIVTPSQWLADLVKQSFFKDYPVKVINNGIDLSVFKPTPSNFRERYGIPEDKFILLGVAFGWGVRKGLDVFIELSKRLDESKFQIVLVGTDKKVDNQLSDNIISIHRTQNQQELAEIYTAADLFVNPTREENFPTVNMESLACGTPIVTFNTGGSPEIIDETCGSVVPCDDVDALQKQIMLISETSAVCSEQYGENAKKLQMFDNFVKYVDLYLCQEKK